MQSRQFTKGGIGHSQAGNAFLAISMADFDDRTRSECL